MNGGRREVQRTQGGSGQAISGRRSSIVIALIFLVLPIVAPLTWAILSFSADPLALEHLPLIAFLCGECAAAVLLVSGEAAWRRQHLSTARTFVLAGSILLSGLAVIGVGVVGVMLLFVGQFTVYDSLDGPQDLIDVPMTASIAVLDILLVIALFYAFRSTLWLSRLIAQSRKARNEQSGFR